MSATWPVRITQFGASKEKAEAYNQALSDAAPYRAELENKNEALREALDRLARLGNEPYFGNSIGNEIAKAALKLTD